VAVAVDAVASAVDMDTGTRTAAKSGLCAALGNNVFDYGHRAAADQMRTSWGQALPVCGHKLWAGH
jgi:hypothetical protein